MNQKEECKKKFSFQIRGRSKDMIRKDRDKVRMKNQYKN